jgi:hypothetical protein
MKFTVLESWMRVVCDVTASIRATGQGFVLEVTAITKAQSNTLSKKRKERKKKQILPVAAQIHLHDSNEAQTLSWSTYKIKTFIFLNMPRRWRRWENGRQRRKSFRRWSGRELFEQQTGGVQQRIEHLQSLGRENKKRPQLGSHFRESQRQLSSRFFRFLHVTQRRRRNLRFVKNQAIIMNNCFPNCCSLWYVLTNYPTVF